MQFYETPRDHANDGPAKQIFLHFSDAICSAKPQWEFENHRWKREKQEWEAIASKLSGKLRSNDQFFEHISLAQCYKHRNILLIYY